MATVQKRIIAAAAAAAVAAGCFAVPAPVAAAVPETWEEVPSWALDELQTTYNLYQNGLTAPIIEKLGALAFVAGVYNGKKLYSQLEPEFSQNVQTLYSGFYYDTDGDIHVTTIYISGRSETRQFIGGASDEHYCILTGNDNNSPPDYLHDCISSGNNITGGLHVRYIRVRDGRTTNSAFTYTNDTGASASVGASYTVKYDATKAAKTCTAFPPTNTDWFGYLAGTDTDGNAVRIVPSAAAVDNDLFEKSPSELVTYVNNYITVNYPDSGVQIPEEDEPPETTVETLPNDEYSGLPAGWNEINPVPLPDIDTPALPVDGSEDFAESIDGLQFLSAFRDGLGFWARSVSWVCEQFPLAARVLLALGLLGLLAFIFWRWSL